MSSKAKYFAPSAVSIRLKAVSESAYNALMPARGGIGDQPCKRRISPSSFPARSDFAVRVDSQMHTENAFCKSYPLSAPSVNPRDGLNLQRLHDEPGRQEAKMLQSLLLLRQVKVCLRAKMNIPLTTLSSGPRRIRSWLQSRLHACGSEGLAT